MNLTQTRSMRPMISPVPPRRGWLRWNWWGGVCLVALVALWWGSRSDAATGCPSSKQESGAKNPMHGLRWHRQTWDGQILRRLKAGSYTYLQVSLKEAALPAKQSPQWFVVMGKGQPRKSRVKMTSYGTRSPFFSRRLQKCFPLVYFGRITASQR